ncbi:MAG: DUF4101 domain-containing protein [Cyanobacteria bacterium REEB67]|nr:DUF4101 domain-containing protein [Cyanobacteria bacterium REEB67]
MTRITTRITRSVACPKAEATLQKPFLTVLIALSLPLAALFAPAAGEGNSLLGLKPAQAANSSPKAAVDYNAGSSLTGENGDATTNTNMGDSAAVQNGDTADTTGSAQTNPPNNSSGSATTAGANDSSMESVWSEQAAPPTPKSSKSKKKSHSRTESSKSSKAKTARDKGGQTSTVTSTATDASAAGAVAGSAATASGDSTAGETYAASPNSGSVLDRPVTLGTVTSGANTQNQSEEEPAAEVKATPPSRPAARPAQSPATGAASNSVAVSHPPDNVFTSKLNVGEHAAPLCATRSFFQSELIRSVSWPGVGPFKGDSDPNDLVDPQENKLTLQTSGDKVTSAELILLHQPGNPQGFINLEMVMDSMLEALGARDKKINDFNSFLEKNKEVLAKNKATEEKPLKTANGPYLISIAGSGKNNESSYLIQVKSKQSAEEASRTPSNEAPESREESNTTANTTRTGSVSVATSIPQNNGPGAGTSGATRTVKKPPEQTPTAVESTRPAAKQPTKTPAKDTTKTGDEESTSTSGGDTLKQEFADTIRSWQSIKQEADKTRDVTLLAKVLTGKALAKQTVAIGWLVKEKKYYEITPKGVNVDKYQEISKAPQRYAVYAHVKELSRLLDDGTNKLNKETDDQYNVNYTLEKTGDHWSIYDSQLIQQPGQPIAGQSKSAPKPKH